MNLYIKFLLTNYSYKKISIYKEILYKSQNYNFLSIFKAFIFNVLIFEHSTNCSLF